MTVSRAFLEKAAAELGYQAGSLEKVVRLGELAAAIHGHPLLNRTLLLKGGTPLNLAYGPPARLSVDLDYNYVTPGGRDAMLAERPQVESAVAGLAERLRYSVQLSPAAFAGRSFYLRFPSVGGGMDRIEVDISYLYRLPLEEPQERALWQPGGLDEPRVRTVSTLELIVGKCIAFLGRVAPRDAWDVTFIANTMPEQIASSRLRSWFIAISSILDHPLPTYTSARAGGKLTPAVIESQLRPMLAAWSGVDPSRLAIDAWAAITPLLQLTASEREFVDEIARGGLRAELLFPDDAGARARAEAHPAIAWKLRNVREQLASDGRN